MRGCSMDYLMVLEPVGSGSTGVSCSFPLEGYGLQLQPLRGRDQIYLIEF